MRHLQIPAIVILLAGTAWLAVPDEEPTFPKTFAWLTGSWRQEDEEHVWEEHWLPPEGGTLLGATRLVVDGQTRLYELSALEQQGDDIFLRLRHFGTGLVPWTSEADGARSWRLTQLDGCEARFEDPTALDLQTIVYRRAGEDGLEVDLVADGTIVQRFRFTRVRR
jgi:hypothetical protein